MQKNTTATIKYFLKKIVQLLLSLFVLSMIVFFVSRIAPGDPLRAYYGETIERMSSQQLEAAEERLGLNEPLVVQYADWLNGAIHGDFGISYQYKQPASDVIGQVFGNTVALAGISCVLIFVLGLLLAVFCVKREGTAADKIICRIGVATNSIPEFFVSLLLVLIFSVTLGALPQSGMVLPVSAIVISHLWYCAYLMRNKLSDEMTKDYILMLKVKGLSENRIIYNHCLKNIMPACISTMAIFLPHLLGGAYVVELVFSYPGIGKLGVESAQYHDYNMLMLVCLITGAIVIVANITAQIINEKLSPQTKEEGGRML